MSRQSIDPRDLRPTLVCALEADLVGPFTLDSESTEALSLPPTRWYVTGFLAPENAPAEEPETVDAETGVGNDEEIDGAAEEREPRGPRTLPSSLGLSVLIGPWRPGGTDRLDVTIRYATYAREEVDAPAEPGDATELAAAGQRRRRSHWVRRPVTPIIRKIPLDAAALRAGIAVGAGLVLLGHLADTAAPGLDLGVRALSLFLVNRRPLPETGAIDDACIFQVSLEVRPEAGLWPRGNPQGLERAGAKGKPDVHEDDCVADLQFRDAKEWAVGHGVSVDPVASGGVVVGARTIWLPTATVPRVVARRLDGVTLSMDALATLDDARKLEEELGGIAAAYGAWIADQSRVPLEGRRAETRETLMLRAEDARKRIAEGIATLGKDKELRFAFRLMNESMALAARKRTPQDYADGEVPTWRLFQLAFVLMNLESVANGASPHRGDVELIYFPTGGGKTEAYLGVIAFALVLRRLRGVARPDKGLGVAVLLRYTLRLLTLDQLGRAATLICALETLRKREGKNLGPERFSIGLWVGRSATPNTLDQAVDEITSFRLGRGDSPCPIPTCPWCKTELDAGTLRVEPTSKPTRVVVGCKNDSCAFSPANNAEGLPMLFVDEHIYRELPCFLVGTVDKFAMLPWRGRTAMLFGHARGRIGKEHLGAMDGRLPRDAEALPDGLLPPELIVQDELHLIAGPLGTMVGLYETAIEALATREIKGEDGMIRRVVPKILASTATIRRAQEQVRALFGRRRMHVFPPPGIDDGETFFSQVDRASPGRLYVGVAAPGRAMKALLIRTYVALLAAGKRLDEEPGLDPSTVDAYLTLVGYFNSLRELGGMRRLLEDEIRTRVGKDPNERAPEDQVGPHPWGRKRDIKYEPVELTSRASTAAIAAAKDKLARPHPCDEQVDVALASNMISVGLDIDRLGLMIIAGQPRTTSEYIQASSRVGRNVRRPGVVVTVYNLFKARDRSHFERFRAYHESFYRFVEAGSVTPFSAPALERGLAGVLVTMTRLAEDALTPPDGVTAVDAMRVVAERAVRAIADKAAFEKRGRSEVAAKRVREEVGALGKNLLEAWASAVAKDADGRVTMYSDLEPGKEAALLFTALDEKRPDPRLPRGKFCAPTSMRDVEPSVHLWKSRTLIDRTEREGGDGE